MNLVSLAANSDCAL